MKKIIKKSQIYSLFFLTWLLTLSLSSIAYAVTPNYVGINENDTFIFDVMYDESAHENYYEDFADENDLSDDWVDTVVNSTLNYDEDIVGMKIVILDVDDEEKDPWGEDGVRIIYNYYEKEEEGDWKLENKDETFAVFKFDKEVYEHLWIYGFIWQYDDEYRLEKLNSENFWFVSTNVDWGEVEEEIEEEFEDDGYDDYSVHTDTDLNRIEMTRDRDDDDEIGEWKEIIEYDDNGVLRYYEEQYDGETMVLAERQFNEITRTFLGNILLIIIIFGALVAIGIITVVVKKKNK